MDELNKHFRREAGEDPESEENMGDILEFPGVQLDSPSEDEGWIDEG
jgi:hypothetical protein